MLLEHGFQFVMDDLQHKKVGKLGLEGTSKGVLYRGTPQSKHCTVSYGDLMTAGSWVQHVKHQPIGIKTLSYWKKWLPSH